MKQHAFEIAHTATWERLDAQLAALRTRRGARRAEGLSELPDLYRQACHHFSLARTRGYSPQLQNRLHELILRAHQHLYGQPSQAWARRAVRFFIVGFPAALRREWRLLLLATLLLYLPAVVVGGLSYVQDDFVYSVLDAGQVASFEEMYNPARGALGREREADTDFMMFGHYIQNNIGIGFRTFAGGILLGLGTVLALLVNGVYFGAVAGHLTRVGYGDPFWAFVATHGALELTAITVTSVAGLKLAQALLAPGALPRAQALVGQAREAVPLVIGAVFMLLGAAFIEAFWSSSTTVPAATKYVVAAALWLTVVAYFVFMGRGRAA